MGTNKVTMRSPEGEIREVEGTPEALTPLMAKGWHQHHLIQGEPYTPPPGTPHLEHAEPDAPVFLGTSEAK
jgi:hypothetical protein